MAVSGQCRRSSSPERHRTVTGRVGCPDRALTPDVPGAEGIHSAVAVAVAFDHELAGREDPQLHR
jgi:hypothetical protein